MTSPGSTSPPQQPSSSPITPGKVSGVNPNAAGTKRSAYVVLTGNPNCGKTTLFNTLTGLRAKVGNYAGVTVERKEGRLLEAPPDLTVRVLDLPGTYSLSPQSLDEQISRDVLLNRLPELPSPELIVVVVDASNLQRNLYYATQVIELGHPTIIALNMMDVARNNGHEINVAKLANLLAYPCSRWSPAPAKVCQLSARQSFWRFKHPIPFSGRAHSASCRKRFKTRRKNCGDARRDISRTPRTSARRSLAHPEQRKSTRIERRTLSSQNSGSGDREPQDARRCEY